MIIDSYSREQERRRRATMADPEAAKANAIEMRQRRQSYRKISDALGIGETTVRMWVDEQARRLDLQRRREKYAVEWPRGRDRMRERRAAPFE